MKNSGGRTKKRTHTITAKFNTSPISKCITPVFTETIFPSFSFLIVSDPSAFLGNAILIFLYLDRKRIEYKFDKKGLHYYDKIMFSISGNDMDPLLRVKFVSECFMFCFSGRSILLYHILRSS